MTLKRTYNSSSDNADVHEETAEVFFIFTVRDIQKCLYVTYYIFTIQYKTYLV